MKNSSTKWTWDDEVWSEYDPQERAPWLIEGDICNAVLSGVIKCRSKEDALLIAAAPELLEALEHCVNYGAMTGSDWVIKKALAAIAKARGEEDMTCKTQKALKELVAACQPVSCQMLHHNKKDQHGDDEACQVVERYERALQQAREVIGDE